MRARSSEALAAIEVNQLKVNLIGFVPLYAVDIPLHFKFMCNMKKIIKINSKTANNKGGEQR